MLKDLKILNGILELKFNEYTYEYTVVVEEDVDSLEIEYVLSEGSSIDIKSNALTDGDNIVYLNVYDEDLNQETYTLYVYKNNSEAVSGIDNYVSSLEFNQVEELSLYKVQILTVSIFLMIVIVFSIIFRRKVKHQ